MTSSRPGTAPAATPAADGTTRTPLRVLLVEDQPDDAELMLIELRNAGFDPQWTRVDTELDYVRELESGPDLILADYVLPAFDALRALDHLRQRKLDVPFIVVSGAVGEDVAVAAVKRGATDYLIKDRLARLGSAAQRAIEEKRQRVEERLREQTRAVLENVADGIVTFDEDGILQSFNASAQRLFGYSAEEIVGRSVQLLTPAPDRTDFLARLTNHLRLDPTQPGTEQQETRGRRKDGTTFPMEFIVNAVQFGNRRLLIGSLRDISERKAQTDALEYQALHDPLTGLPNRTLFRDRLGQAILAADRNKQPFGLLLLDLDRFKDVNDSLGHEHGDALLEAVAQRVRRAVRHSDTAARLGGDEFAVLAPGVRNAEGASALARKIRTALESFFLIRGQSVDVGASIGICVYPEHASDSSTLLHRADVAMYLAKRTRSGYALYDADRDRDGTSRPALSDELRDGIAEDQLVLHYQPLIALQAGSTYGVEALVRWRHPREGLMLPDQFIPLAEKTELMKPLTTWVLTEALGQLRLWRDARMDLTLAVNLSARNLQDPELMDTIVDLLRRHRLSPDLLTLEITERTAVDPTSTDAIGRLHRMGVRLSIDDFGVGYSSLANLKRLPVAELKIDRSFVTDLASDEENAAILRPIVTMGHNLGVRVVAEGVEDAESQRMLMGYGCDCVQGYLISRPLASRDVAEWLATSPWGLPPGASRWGKAFARQVTSAREGSG